MSIEDVLTRCASALETIARAVTEQRATPLSEPKASSARAKQRAGSEPPSPAPTSAQPVETATDKYRIAAEAVTNLARVRGREAAVALLSKFNATKLPDVATESLDEVIAAARAELNAA